MTIHRTRPVAAVAIATLFVAPGVGSAVTTATGSSATRPTATATVAEPQTERVTVAAPSLDGNLLGDPSEVEVEVQTPGSYATSPERRYPVVYFLAGYDEPASVGSIGLELQQLVSDGEADEMILVGVSGDNALGGSFYVDSPVSGRWASAIVNDVVGSIDEQYRTLATPASRGIAGFSMGGYGALALAMENPSVFGAVYALSAGLFAPGGLAESQMFADPTVAADFLAGQQELAAMSPQDAAAELPRVMGRSGDLRFSAAYGAAFAPDPDGPPPWIRYPITGSDGDTDPQVWELWEAGFGGLAAQADDSREDLLALRGIVIDYGIQDSYAWIPPGCEYLHEQLDRVGIPNRLESFQGGHGPVGPRAGEVMLPFFAEVLDAT
jgi:enterochelin esterase-like enzyme